MILLLHPVMTRLEEEWSGFSEKCRQGQRDALAEVQFTGTIAAWNTCDWNKIFCSRTCSFYSSQGCNVPWICSYSPEGFGEVSKVVEVPAFQPGCSTLKSCCLVDNVWLVSQTLGKGLTAAKQTENSIVLVLVNWGFQEERAREVTPEIEKSYACGKYSTKKNAWNSELKIWAEPNQIF